MKHCTYDISMFPSTSVPKKNCFSLIHTHIYLYIYIIYSRSNDRGIGKKHAQILFSLVKILKNGLVSQKGESPV